MPAGAQQEKEEPSLQEGVAFKWPVTERDRAHAEAELFYIICPDRLQGMNMLSLMYGVWTAMFSECSLNVP